MKIRRAVVAEVRQRDGGCRARGVLEHECSGPLDVHELVRSSTTTVNPMPSTSDPTTTVAVSLIPATSISNDSGGGQLSPAELPRTGSHTAWVAGIGVFTFLLGLYMVAVRRRWAS